MDMTISRVSVLGLGSDSQHATSHCAAILISLTIGRYGAAAFISGPALSGCSITVCREADIYLTVVRPVLSGVGKGGAGVSARY